MYGRANPQMSLLELGVLIALGKEKLFWICKNLRNPEVESVYQKNILATKPNYGGSVPNYILGKPNRVMSKLELGAHIVQGEKPRNMNLVSTSFLSSLHHQSCGGCGLPLLSERFWVRNR
jgi:hypothetical protein